MTKKVLDGKERGAEHLEDREKKDVQEPSAVQEDSLHGAESSQLKIAELEIEVLKHKEQSDKYRDELLRKAADFENFRKQKERESMMASSRALENIIRELLPVVDDVKRVLQHAPLNAETSAEARPYIEGVELVKKSLEKWLDHKGVKAIDSKGMKLDVNFHEAISQVDQPDAEPDTIIDEYQTGYLLGDKVIRHAKVIVAR